MNIGKPKLKEALILYQYLKLNIWNIWFDNKKLVMWKRYFKSEEEI